jgi:hypothetical protein
MLVRSDFSDVSRSSSPARTGTKPACPCGSGAVGAPAPAVSLPPFFLLGGVVANTLLSAGSDDLDIGFFEPDRKH